MARCGGGRGKYYYPCTVLIMAAGERVKRNNNDPLTPPTGDKVGTVYRAVRVARQYAA